MQCCRYVLPFRIDTVTFAVFLTIYFLLEIIHHFGKTTFRYFAIQSSIPFPLNINNYLSLSDFKSINSQ